MRVCAISFFAAAVLLRPASGAVKRGEPNGRYAKYSPGNNQTSASTTYTVPTVRTSTVNNNGTSAPITTDLASETAVASCIRPGYTTVEIVYTSTVIFSGHPSDYTPPYEPLPGPTYCVEFSNAPINPTSFSKVEPSWSPSWSVITFSTTEKNPSVIFETNSIPGYTQEPIGGPPGNNAEPGDNTKLRPGDSQTTARSVPPPVTITAGPDEVIIGSSTISNLEPGQSTTVTVGDGTFTIHPTAVVGEGGTVAKPPPVQQQPQQPITGNVGGLDVSLSGSLIVADGTTMTVPPQGLTTDIGGAPVSVGPGRLVVGEETLSLPTVFPEDTDVFVIGGGLLTAIDSTIIVLRLTTMTYGPADSLATLVVDDDTITFDSDGVHIHDSTLGGPNAGPTDTTYALVGGVTITELGSTLVVVGDHTYTIGAGISAVTTEINDEVLTIGSDGVIFGTMTLTRDATVVGTIGSSSTSVETSSSGPGNAHNREGDEDDAATVMLVPSFMIIVFIAMGVWSLA